MESAKQRVRATAARKKEEKKAKETEGGPSSTPKTVSKVSKRKPDGKDNRPKRKSPLKSSHGVGKGVMTSSGPVIEGPRCLLTHKDYAVEEVGSFIKPTDIGPCDLLGTEDLGTSSLFDLARVCLLPQVMLVPSLFDSLD